MLPRLLTVEGKGKSQEEKANHAILAKFIFPGSSAFQEAHFDESKVFSDRIWVPFARKVSSDIKSMFLKTQLI